MIMYVKVCRVKCFEGMEKFSFLILIKTNLSKLSCAITTVKSDIIEIMACTEMHPNGLFSWLLLFML